jgi:hypothetical protein
MLDDNTMCGSSLTPCQKYMSKAANWSPNEVEYDGVTYKICMAELAYDILYIGMLLLVAALTLSLLVLIAKSLRQQTKQSIMSILRVVVTTSLLNDALSSWVPSHKQSN